jgi:GNAT superfamily N-acetyltransferase
MSDTSVRPFQPSDLPGVLRVLGDAMPADPISEARFTRQVLLDPNVQRDGMPVATRGGRVIGFALSIARQTPLENAPSDADRGYVTLLAVTPDAQRRGVGSMLLDYAENYLRSQGRAVVMIASYAPGYFIPGVDVYTYAGALALLKRRGYAEIYRPLAMETSLWNLSVPAWVREKGRAFALKPFETGLTLPLLEFVRREFPGDWVRVVRETAGKIVGGDSPNRLISALDGENVVGFAHYENERFGPIGVAANQRGRGIGQVLMFATLQAQREAGLRTAWFLWSDDKTAERIYNVAGFKETRRFALMKKTLQS